MRQIVINIEDSHYALLIQFLRTLDYVKVVTSTPDDKGSSQIIPSYDFSDIAGKLKWTGDAVEEQRKMRNEW